MFGRLPAEPSPFVLIIFSKQKTVCSACVVGMHLAAKEDLTAHILLSAYEPPFSNLGISLSLSHPSSATWL